MKVNQKTLIWIGTLAVVMLFGLIPAVVAFILGLWINQMIGNRPNVRTSEQRGFEVQPKVSSQENDVPQN